MSDDDSALLEPVKLSDIKPDERIVAVRRLSRDMRKVAETMTNEEARFLVGQYYTMQKQRIRAQQQADSLGDKGAPNSTLTWLQEQTQLLEEQVAIGLDRYSGSHPVGVWMRSNYGIGKVLASGYLAYIKDIRTFTTVGKLWRYCGVDPTCDKLVRGEKICFNPKLKRLVFLTGECFKRCSPKNEEAFYRHWYDKRKAYENEKNERGDYAPLAELALKTKKFGDDTKAKEYYSQGKLPPGRIDMRSMRWSAKLFLSHLHFVWWTLENAEQPYPGLYVKSILNHNDIIDAPNWQPYPRNGLGGMVVPVDGATLVAESKAPKKPRI